MTAARPQSSRNVGVTLVLSLIALAAGAVACVVAVLLVVHTVR